MSEALMSVVWTIVFCLAIGGAMVGASALRFWYVRRRVTRKVDQVIQRGRR